MGRLLTLLFLCGLLVGQLTDAKIFTVCDAVKQLQIGGVSRTFISNYICVMQSESNMNTSLKTGPKTKCSFYFGIFQISSLDACIRGRKGGLCNKKCEDFLDDNIQDDIACAKIIVEKKGFKYWTGWMNKCKNKPLPNIAGCKTRSARDVEEIEEAAEI